MRQIREILQLTAAGWGQRQIGRTLGCDHVTVGDILKRARAADVLLRLTLNVGTGAHRRAQ